MNPTRAAWLLLSLFAVSPRSAEACACCDASSVQTPVAWSADGQKLLVTVSDRTGCRVLDYAMLLPAGAASASVCHDLRGEPAKAIACTDEAAFYDATGEERIGKPRALAETGLKAQFPVAAKVDKARFRVRKSTAPAEMQAEVEGCIETGNGCSLFTLEFREGKTWRPIWSTVSLHGRKCPVDRKCETMPAIMVYPSPAGGTVAVRKFDFDAGSMMFLTSLEWVSLTP